MQACFAPVSHELRFLAGAETRTKRANAAALVGACFNLWPLLWCSALAKVSCEETEPASSRAASQLKKGKGSGAGSVLEATREMEAGAAGRPLFF